MSFSRTYSAQTFLLRGHIVTIETDITPNTLHAFSIVGLGDKAVEEAKDRVSSALKNSGFSSPKNANQKTVVALSPAEMRKEGSSFDAAIAVSYLLSAGDIAFDPEKKLFLGELALNGEIMPIRGMLALAEQARRQGFEELYVPEKNAEEAALIGGIDVYGVRTLADLISHIDTKESADRGNERARLAPREKTPVKKDSRRDQAGFDDIRGQEAAKRGLVIAAAGGHNILLYGPPGTGKTMLARAFAGIMPDLSEEDILEVTGIHSIAGAADGLVTAPPFRAPHHTSSYVSVIGGGAFPKPGEVTLAHKGILFLDEFPEFDKRVIESLREPLEDAKVSIARSKGTATFPSNFTLIAAMNPCPCGNRGSRQKACICKPSDLDRYKRKLSGPILDRIDLAVEVAEISYGALGGAPGGMSADHARTLVARARKMQEERFAFSEKPIRTNSDMSARDLERFAPLEPDVRQILDSSAEKLALSPRAYHRTIKLARTIADLDGKEHIEAPHILEAIQYRPKG